MALLVADSQQGHLVEVDGEMTSRVEPGPLAVEPFGTDTLAEVLGGRLRELREEQGLDQRTLARHLGISKSSLSAMESGMRTPPLSVLVRMAATLNLTLDGLLGASIRPTPLRDPRLIRCMRGIEAMDEECLRFVVPMLEALLNAYRELIPPRQESSTAELTE